MCNQKYVLISAARNEEKYIENTIKAVIAQTLLPVKWIIVSDGSTDQTDEIIKRYASNHNFICLHRIEMSGHRNFASKVYALNAGLNRLKNVDYEFIGNIDSDITFAPDYFDQIITLFKKNPKLGVAGGIILEKLNNKYVLQNISLNSVAGAVQFYRKKCFENTDGYIPLEFGGEDAVMEVKARMHGWEVQTFPEIKVFHHRRVGGGNNNILKVRIREGIMFYVLGYHLLFFIFRACYRLIDRPYFFGSIFQILGYILAGILGKKKAIPSDIIKFIRKEQMQRLKTFFGLSSEI